jgi:hypothetical protein
VVTIAVESPNGSSARSTDPGEVSVPAMSSVGTQIRDNPHASKMARLALELPILHMWLSEYFRLDQVEAVAGKERNNFRRPHHPQPASMPSEIVLFHLSATPPKVPMVQQHVFVRG